jgi:hypothetical protein
MKTTLGTNGKLTLPIGNLPTHLTYSVDWRFLVEMPSECQILIFSEAYDGFGFPLSQISRSKIVIWRCHDLLPLKNSSSPITTNVDSIQAEATFPPFQKHSFDFILVPDGLPRKTAIPMVIDLLREGGSIIIGFSNRIFDINFIRNKAGKSKSEFAFTLANWFNRKGMFEIVLFGTIPNHLIPDIIFPLRPYPIKFALNRFYGHKISNIILNLLTIPGIMPIALWFLPAYYLIATKKHEIMINE